MRRSGLAKSLIGGFAALLGPSALAQAQAPPPTPPSALALPGSGSASLAHIQRWFELEAPFSRRLKFSFDTRPTPTFEALHLQSFEGRATLWRSGRIELSLFERVAPTLELDCLTTCQPVMEHKLGVDWRAHLGAVGRQIPDTFLFFRGVGLRQSMGFTSRTWLGIGGLLDF